MKKNQQLEQLNQKLQDHVTASGYTLSKDENKPSAQMSGPRSESAKMTLAAQTSKPSSRKAFEHAHVSANTTAKPQPKPLLPKKPIKPLLKPLMPAKPKA